MNKTIIALLSFILGGGISLIIVSCLFMENENEKISKTLKYIKRCKEHLEHEGKLDSYSILITIEHLLKGDDENEESKKNK